MPRSLLREHIKTFFFQAKSSTYWEKIKKLPMLLKYVIGIFFVLFGLLGMVTPIPAGSLFLLIGLALTIGIRRARSWSLWFIHITRIHILYGKLYMWWHMRKR